LLGIDRERLTYRCGGAHQLGDGAERAVGEWLA
jgi:hypothetical protein